MPPCCLQQKIKYEISDAVSKKAYDKEMEIA